MLGKRLTLSEVHCDMETYIVQITDEALAEIYHYIAETLKAPNTALDLYDRIANEILTLERFPKRYRILSQNIPPDCAGCWLATIRYSMSSMANALL